MARGRLKKVDLAPVVEDSPPLVHPAGEGVDGGGLLAEPPREMSEGGAEIWREVYPIVVAMCPLRDTDSDSLRMYCETSAIHRRASREMEGGDLVLIANNGSCQKNPLLGIIDKCVATMMKLSERFGFDPASKKRLNLAMDKAEADPMGEFIKRGK